MSDPSPAAKRIAEEISRIAGHVPGVTKTFGDDKKLAETLASILATDDNFQQTGGIFFQPGSDAFETADRFTRIHVEQYRQTGRPSLPALAMHHAQILGLDPTGPHYRALILVAARAELAQAVEPDYHSKFHYVDVAAMTATYLEKNNELAAAGIPGAPYLTPEQQALALTAAIGHDLDHPGGKNPPGDHYHFEEKSFRALEPLLIEAGLGRQEIGDFHTMLLTTSPDGPHAVLKAVAKAQCAGQAPDWGKLDPNGKFPELRALTTPALIQMAAILSDADLYASSGAGMKSNVKMSELFTRELQKAGHNFDFRSDADRQYFLDNIIGEHYASVAGLVTAGAALEALRAETKQNLSATAAKNAPPPPAGP